MCSFGSCQTRFEFLSQFRKVRNALECFVAQVQTHLPKTKRAWPMKINVICTVYVHLFTENTIGSVNNQGIKKYVRMTKFIINKMYIISLLHVSINCKFSQYHPADLFVQIFKSLFMARICLWVYIGNLTASQTLQDYYWFKCMVSIWQKYSKQKLFLTSLTSHRPTKCKAPVTLSRMSSD